MTHDPAEPRSPLRRQRLRLAVIVLAGAEILLLVGVVALFAPGLSSNEALSRTIAQGAMVLAAAPLAALAVPALILGLKARALKTALALALLAIPVFIAVFFFT